MNPILREVVRAKLKASALGGDPGEELDVRRIEIFTKAKASGPAHPRDHDAFGAFNLVMIGMGRGSLRVRYVIRKRCGTDAVHVGNLRTKGADRTVVIVTQSKAGRPADHRLCRNAPAKR